MKKVAVTGATGFVGSGLVDELLQKGYDVLALVRKKSDRHSTEPRYVELECDLFDPHSYSNALKECDLIINSVGIIRENPGRGITFEKLHTELTITLVDTAKTSGVKDFILISALGVREEGVSRYQTSKFKAEQYLMQSGLRWSIFRPSFVLGPESGFISELGFVAKLPVVPIFGDGLYNFEPVHRDILAAGVSVLLERDEGWEQILEFRGKEQYTYLEIIRGIRKKFGKDKSLFLHVPKWLVKFGIWLFGWLPFFPITMDQFKMLIEGNTGSGVNAVELLKLPWYNLEESLSRS
jgi:uncharacterized protein YbjT (DUF2867 family)